MRISLSVTFIYCECFSEYDPPSTNIMKIIPCSFFVAWRRCLCQSNARRSHSTRTGQSSPADDSGETFEPEDFSEARQYCPFDVDPEEVNIRDPAMKKKMKSLQTEMYLLNETGGEVPRHLSSKQWLDLLTINSFGKRILYLRKLWFNEQRKSSESKVQAIKRELYLQEKEKNQGAGPFFEEGDKKYVQYGLNYNTLFRGIYQQRMNRFYYYRLLKAMTFGPDIVVDCGYDNEMNSQDLHRCAKDIHRMWMANKVHFNPFNIRFCNLNERGSLFPRIRHQFLDFDDPDLPFNYSSFSYLNFYDKKRLVYLTPHSTSNLRSYNPNNVYIIGALMNSSRGHLSSAKAKREGLRTAKFPINLYVDWNAGVKSLRASKALDIMNDLKEQRDWRTIFEQHLPVVKSAEETEEDKRQEKLKKSFNMRFYKL